MKSLFLKLIDADDPKTSSSRFLSLITVLTILYVWLWLSIYTGKMVDVPIGVYTFVGVVLGGGALKSFAEKRNWRNESAK
jgi:hypothetical protein